MESEKSEENDKILRLEVYLRQGMDIDNDNSVEGTFVDIIIKSNERLEVIDETITKTINLTEQLELSYYKKSELIKLDINKTFNELNINNGDKLEVFYHNQYNIVKPDKDDHEEVYLHDELDKQENILELICTTRIFDIDGIPYKRVRILVNKYDYINFLIEDVSKLWNKTGLKFKYGRIILSGDKSYQDYDIQNYSEITVTGGRG